MESESLQVAELIAPSPTEPGKELALTLAGAIAVMLGDCSDAFQETWPEVLHATRAWIQYGTVGFAVLCIVVGALEAVAGK